MNTIMNMKAIEYNMLKTLIKMIVDGADELADDYNLHDVEIPVLPAYPADLTTIKKPSIIVRKVDTEQYKVGMGNILGRYWNDTESAYDDLYGKCHMMMLQFDILTATQTDNSLIESMIAEGIFNKLTYTTGGRFTVYDFTSTDEHAMGSAQLWEDPVIRNQRIEFYTSNDFQVGVVRQKFKIMQTILPKQEYVDLTKWIKQSFTIKLY